MASILLVEDEKILRDAFCIILESKAHSVETATNGLEAFDACQKRKFDLILLDLMMPVLGGVGFLEKYTALSLPHKTKIVVLSNLSSGSQISQALQFAIHAQVVKSSLTPSKLISLVDETLQDN